MLTVADTVPGPPLVPADTDCCRSVVRVPDMDPPVADSPGSVVCATVRPDTTPNRTYAVRTGAADSVWPSRVPLSGSANHSGAPNAPVLVDSESPDRVEAPEDTVHPVPVALVDIGNRSDSGNRPDSGPSADSESPVRGDTVNPVPVPSDTASPPAWDSGNRDEEDEEEEDSA